MPRKRTKEWNGPVSEEALIVWLMDKPYLIMKALREGCENATEIADELGKPIAWVSKRTGRMADIGLIGKEGPDLDGVRKISLTEKGLKVLESIDNINGNLLFIELKRSLGITSPQEDKRSTVHEEAARVKFSITSDEGGCQDLDPLYAKVQEASMAGVGDWYACEDLEWLFSTVTSERWNERSRLLLIRMIGRAVEDSRTDHEHVAAFNGLVGPLHQLALDVKADINVRAESVIAIGSLRTYDRKVPDQAFEAMLQITWNMLSPQDEEPALIEDATSGVLKDWKMLLSDGQNEVLFTSVYRSKYRKMPTLDMMHGKIGKRGQREVVETRFERYRSLISNLLERDIPKSDFKDEVVH